MCFFQNADTNIPQRRERTEAEKFMARPFSALMGGKESRQMFMHAKAANLDPSEFKTMAEFRRAFLKSGAFTARASVPGEAAPNAVFAGGPENERTGAAELTNLMPLIPKR
jgi:hypothetical protein